MRLIPGWKRCYRLYSVQLGLLIGFFAFAQVTLLPMWQAQLSPTAYAAANSIRQGKLSAGTAYAEKLRGLKAPREVLSDVYAGLAELALEQSQLLIALECKMVLEAFLMKEKVIIM